MIKSEFKSLHLPLHPTFNTIIAKAANKKYKIKNKCHASLKHPRCSHDKLHGCQKNCIL